MMTTSAALAETTIGFIGLGVMGRPMAANLLDAGYRLRVLDLDPAKMAALQALGGEAVENARELAARSAVVMSSLPGPSEVREIGLGPEGLIANLPEGAIWLELSTSNLEVCGELNRAAASRGVHVLDCPVSGGDEGAAAGTLTVLVGGERAVFDRALPILEVIGTCIEYLGPAGAGYAAKIAQVLLCYLHTVALSEALVLGAGGGVSPDKMLDIIRNSTGRSYVADRYGPCILNGDYDPSFSLGLALKDLRLAMELARKLKIDLPMSDFVTTTYARAAERFGNDAHHLMAVKLLEDACETPLRSFSEER